MNHNLFQAFDLITRIDLTLDNAALVAHRYDEEDMYLLYQFGNFYVELLYLEEIKEIAAIRSDDSDDILAPYLENIDISYLLK